MIDFPANPTTNQIFTAGGVQWLWDGTKWVANGVGSGYVPLSGGTMTGPLILNADPTVALGAATKQQVDAHTPGENRIINGDMRINQRGVVSGGATNGYTVDRWSYWASQPSKVTWAPTAVSPSTFGFPYCITFTTPSTPYTSLATETFEFYQPIEADMISDFNWGQSTAQPVTLSFWAFSNITGNFSGSIHNYANTRSFPFTFNIPTAGVWVRYIIPIFGDPNGTWVMSGNAGAAYVMFDLGCGANQRGPAGAWASANYIGVTGSVSLVANANATLGVTGVKLEIGSIASRFVQDSLAKRMADCQRYYQGGVADFNSYGAIASSIASTFNSLQQMRASPTVAYQTPSYANCSGVTAVVYINGVKTYVLATAAGGLSLTSGFTANAEL